MGSSAPRLTGGGSEEPITSAAGPSATADGTSNFHTALDSSSLDEVALGDCSGAGSSVEPKSEYFSPRIEKMMRSKNQYPSAVEHEIEHSKSHRTEVRSSGPSDSSEGSNDSEEVNEDFEEVKRKQYEEVDRENEEIFTELMNDPQWKHPERGDFFWKLPPHPEVRPKLGQKIGKGGQAEIFELIDSDGTVQRDFLLKVFNRGIRLSELKHQWLPAILQRAVRTIVFFGWMLDDGRFAFVMSRCWGDLRKLIDQAMQEKNNQCPPFPHEWSGRTLHAKEIMRRIAFYMYELHEQGIIHGDLKAANILLMAGQSSDMCYSIIVADFECSIGVFGTGFWRAPEILMALNNRSAMNFSKKVDVYSYGMTCFEIVTGRLPFEGELEVCRASNDLVIDGLRPKLPSDLDVNLKYLIERCWNPIPNERPSFLEIFQKLSS